MTAVARILVAEDERIVGADVAATLARAGYDVAGVVGTGAEALERASEMPLDLVLMDIGLPGPMDGVDAALRLRSKHGVPVVYLTAHADSGTVDRAKRARPLGFVVKPFESRELLAAVEIALHREAEPEPDARRQEAALARLRLRDEEARRISRDLHDEAGQLLVGVHLALDDMVPELRPEARPRVRQLRDLLDRAQEELRRICHEMRPLLLEDLGLEAALQALAQAAAARSALDVRVTGAAGGRLDPTVESALYRIVQEAVNNAVKHADATKVHVHLSPGPSTIRCSVRDDGRGFDPEEANARPSRGLGLLGIQERLEALGGTLRIQSQAGFGTELVVSIPRPATED